MIDDESDDELTRECAADAARELIAAGWLRRVVLGSDEERLFSDCDLASFAENRLGISADPRALDDAHRAELGARATDDPIVPPGRRLDPCFWVLVPQWREPLERVSVGTISIGEPLAGSRWARVASLYIFPELRGRGMATGILTALRAALATRRIGLRLDTEWCWRDTLTFYLHAGMWVRGWKHAISLAWTPAVHVPRIQIEKSWASLSVVLDGALHPLLRAERVGDRLQLHDEPCPEALRALRLDASSTLAVALALRGWPLIRSAELWERCRGSDAQHPEALAWRISMFEAWSRHRGWRVETPRIPGLKYPTWLQLQKH